MCRVAASGTDAPPTSTPSAPTSSRRSSSAPRPAAPCGEVPFDAEDPINTPRGLKTTPKVVDAMQAAIDAIRAAGVPFDAEWGSLQVAGDRGAPAYPSAVATGDLAGNANALASRDPIANTDRYKPITYGSSHIQAVRTSPTARSCRGRSSPTASTRTPLRPGRRTRPGCSPGSVGGVRLDAGPDPAAAGGHDRAHRALSRPTRPVDLGRFSGGFDPGARN